MLPRGVIIHTTRGDIMLKLFPDECPHTVENFTTHARNGWVHGGCWGGCQTGGMGRWVQVRAQGAGGLNVPDAAWVRMGTTVLLVVCCVCGQCCLLHEGPRTHDP